VGHFLLESSEIVSEKRRLLVIGPPGERTKLLVENLSVCFDVDHSPSLTDSLRSLASVDYAGFVVANDERQLTSALLLESSGIIEQIPDGLAVLDARQNIVWANARLNQMTGHESVTGLSFFDAFGTPEIMGPDFCPFNTALATRESAKSHLRVGDKIYFEVHAAPVESVDPTAADLLIVTVRDVSVEVVQQQKLNAIYYAGLELGDLSPDELYDMSVEDRVELLKCKILHYTQDLLEFETVEIRLLDKNTGRLDQLLSVGMEQEATDRELFAEPTGNGVTGFVAATGKSYLCEDTDHDPLYLTGSASAHSSLTVPLNLHDEVLGTFNVESPGTGSFDEFDLQFLELFSREVAVALNTLELLVVEKATTASQSSERLLLEVANPVDEILNDAAWILERYIGHEPNVCDRLRRILQHTRRIRQMIHRVGESMAPEGAYCKLPNRQVRPKLRGKRILVADADDAVRGAAHELLGRYGCDVETAHSGEEACLMARTFHYDAVLADIRLPDMTGYECFVNLRKIHSHLVIILMTGYGYDPSHSIVKARQDGLKAVLYKPFRLEQLLNEVENAVTPTADTPVAAIPHGRS
jgi:CheY-like chemotaxis protein/PAS domain-containing protein